ncbi:sensor histidine kinase [Mucilaginibacter pedocola]|uniref:sensor histidine kinase n=1 Tax=Mucilaginibacter pedocola TaxID=1792845 RepID=UPI001390441A|nr:sensor histidine kinase [Mucilaginibacter pedocola]
MNASVGHFAVYYALNIALFYAQAHLVLDFAFFRTNRPYIFALGLTFVELVAYFFLKLLLDYLSMRPNASISGVLIQNRQFLLANLWRGIYFIGFSIAYWSMRYMLRYKERNHRIETEQLKTEASKLELENKYISVENAYLQNQISPHLLFNSLNFIYTKVYKGSEEAGKSVSLLSDLMRYSLTSTDDTRTVTLRRELEQVQNLIELCRMRFPDHFHLKFRKRGKMAQLQIIPLVLITLVENMMKHGDLGDARSPALVRIEVQDGHIEFETRNKKKLTKLYPASGLGLNNIRKRLANFYQGRYRLAVNEDEEIFTTHLIIEL